MEPRQGPTPPPYPQRPTAVRESDPLPTAPCVAVVFKEHRYDNGAPKTWLFAQIDQVTVVNGRLQLLREGYGVVFDVPDEEVEQVYTIDQDRSMPMGPASPSQQK